MSSNEDDDVVPYEEGEDEVMEGMEASGDLLPSGDVDEDALEYGDIMFGPYGPVEINDTVFEELHLPPVMAKEVQNAWHKFLGNFETKLAAGEAIYAAMFEAAPSIQNLFKTPRAVQGMRFMYGMNNIVESIHDPPQNKAVLESLSFQHLDLEVTGPRTQVFRDAIVDLLAQELGSAMTTTAQVGFSTLLGYVGACYIFVRREYQDRIKIILSSWATANNKPTVEAAKLNSGQSGSGIIEDKLEAAVDEETILTRKQSKSRAWVSGGNGNSNSHSQGHQNAHSNSNSDSSHKTQTASFGDFGNKEKSGGQINFKNAAVPQTFPDMFAFNTAVMGMSAHNWMNEILSSFDAIVTNTANSYRLQEECDVVSLRLAKFNGTMNFGDYKSVMLASLRSLCKDWGSTHEVAWSWLWINIERLLKAMLGRPRKLESALDQFLQALTDEQVDGIRREIYSRFFAVAPAGQDHFKQSTTRLHFIADKVVSMTMDMYKDPKKLVADISALGLRHVGYGIPIELFGPFVTACVLVVTDLTEDPLVQEAFRWSLGLLTRILTRVISEGSTIVMKAINANSAKQLKLAVACAPRGKRANWMLHVQVGTQSISPFMIAIKNGALDAAQAILADLLTIRADRDRYYYGVDKLFQRHPDIVRRICMDAPPLLPTLLNGLIWRSRITEDGFRRVNYYVQHLLMDGEGLFAKTIEWLCDFQDPSVMCDPVVALVTDTVWDKLVFHNFLFSKIWFLFTLIVFSTGQSILTHHGEGEDELTSQEELFGVFALRVFIYIFSMGVQVRHHIYHMFRSIRMGDFIWIGQLPIPAYLQVWQETVGLMLTIDLLALIASEPILHCLTHHMEKTFGQYCEGSEVKFVYSLLSSLGVVFYFVLLTDLSVLSTKVSAFVLVCRRVMGELVLSILAATFLIITFSFAVCALDQGDPHFNGFSYSLLHLAKMILGMVPGDDHDQAEQYPSLMACSIVYMVVSAIFLLNMLIAQLTCAYQATYDDMVGYARLNRGRIIVDTMPFVSAGRWERFINGLQLDKPIEFGQGDIGLSGGIQVLELASLNVTTVDMIKRYGGTTSPEAMWPQDGEANHDDIDKFEILERTVQRSLARMHKALKGGVGTGSSIFGSSMPSGVSGIMDQGSSEGNSD